MELRNKKYIKNTNQLPRFNYGWVGPVIDAVGSMAGTFRNYEDANDLVAQGDTRMANVGNVQYQYTNPVNSGQVMGQARNNTIAGTIGSAAKGAAAGTAILPGWGTLAGGVIGAIGGLFGGLNAEDEQRRQLSKAYVRTTKQNQSNYALAATKNQHMENARKGYYSNGVLDGYAEGKIPSASGEVDAGATAKVSNGEWIIDPINGTQYRVPGKKNNKDSVLAYVKDQDIVLPNKGGVSDEYAKTGDLNEAIMQTLNNYKCGKLPKFDKGKVNGQLLNAIGSGIGALGGIYQFFDANNQTAKRSKTYVAHPYTNEIIDVLGNLRMSSLPIVNQYRSAEARANDAIRNSGGLNAGQRAIARIAALNATQQNIGSLYSTNQAQNNQYRSQYAQALANLGQQDRAAKMQADQWDLDYYSKAHAARQQGKQMGMYNTINHVLEGLKGAYNISLYDKMYGLYADEQERKDAEAKAYIDSLNKNKPKTRVQNAVPVPATQKSTTPERNNTFIGDNEGRIIWTPQNGISWGNLMAGAPRFNFPGLATPTYSAATNIPTTRSYPSTNDQLRSSRYQYENAPAVNGGLSDKIAAKRFNLASLLPWLN